MVAWLISHKHLNIWIRAIAFSCKSTLIVRFIIFLTSSSNINMNTISYYFFYYLLKFFVMLTSLLLLIIPLILSKHCKSTNILLKFIWYLNIEINTLWSPQSTPELRIRWKLLGVYWTNVFYPKMLFNDSFGTGNISLSPCERSLFLNLYKTFFFYHMQSKNS